MENNTPNEATIAAMRAAEMGDTHKADNVDAIFDDIDLAKPL